MKNMYKKLGILLTIFVLADSCMFASSLTRSARVVGPNVVRAIGTQGAGGMYAQSVSDAGQTRSFIAFSPSLEWDKYPSSKKMKKLQQQSAKNNHLDEHFNEYPNIIAQDKKLLDMALAISDDLDKEILHQSEFSAGGALRGKLWQENPSGLIFASKKYRDAANQSGLTSLQTAKQLSNVVLAPLVYADFSDRLRKMEFEIDKKAYQEAKKLARDIKNKLNAESGPDEKSDLIEID